MDFGIFVEERRHRRAEPRRDALDGADAPGDRL